MQKWNENEKIEHMLFMFDTLGKEATKPLPNSCGGCFIEGFMYSIRFDTRNNINYDLFEEIETHHMFTEKGYTIEMMEEILEDEYEITIDWKSATCPICGGEIEELSHISQNLDEDGVPENGWCDCVG